MSRLSVRMCAAILLIAAVSAASATASEVRLARRLLTDYTQPPYNKFAWYTEYNFPSASDLNKPSFQGLSLKDCLDKCLGASSCQILLYYYSPAKYAGDCHLFDSSALGVVSGDAYDTPQDVQDTNGNGLYVAEKK